MEKRIDALIEEQFKDQGVGGIIKNLEAIIDQIINDNTSNKKKNDLKQIVKLIEGMVADLPIAEKAKEEIIAVLPDKVKEGLQRNKS